MHEIFTIQEESLCADIKAGEVASFRQVHVTKKSARVVQGEYVTTANSLADITDEALVAQARSAEATRQEFHGFAASGNFKGSEGPEALDMPSMAQNLEGFLSDWHKQFPDFILSGKVEQSIVKRHLHNTQGMRLDCSEGTQSYEFYLKRRGSPNIIDSFMYTAGHEPKSPLTLLDFHGPFLKAFDKVAPIEKKIYPICMLEGQTSMFAEFIGGLNPERFHRGAGLFAKKLGEQIFHQDITMGTNFHSDTVYRPFDDEGTIPRSPFFTFIGQGVFTAIPYDVRSAKKFGTFPTGHGTRAYNSGVTVSPAPLAFRAGKRTLKQWWQNLDECIVVHFCAGGDMTATGDFSTPVALGFLVRNGEVIGKVAECSLVGNLQDYLGENFLGFSSDAPAGGIQPALLAKMMVVPH